MRASSHATFRRLRDTDGGRSARLVLVGMAQAAGAQRKVQTPPTRNRGSMSDMDESPSTASTPAWALQQATEEMYNIKDADVIAQRPEKSRVRVKNVRTNVTTST